MRSTRLGADARRPWGWVLCACMAWCGCGESGLKETQMVKPEVPPEVAGKDSMNAFLAQMKTKKAGGRAAVPASRPR